LSIAEEEARVLVATPNIAVDRTVRLPELRPGQVLRPHRAMVTAGGKGLNVGRAAHALGGAEATLVSFRGRSDAAHVDQLFGVEPVRFVGVDVPGEARVATIYLEDSGRVTVLNEPGPQLTGADWSRYEDAISAELANGTHRTLVCSGSLPPGAPEDAYGRLVHIGHRAGVQVIVDAARTALAAALPAGPDIVTPNIAEADSVLSGHTEEAVDEGGPEIPDRARAAVQALCSRGARSAAVTAGASGTAYGELASRTGKLSGDLWIPAPRVAVVNPIGAGDAFVGGLVYALEAGQSDVDAIRFATATASASVETELAGDVDPKRVAELVAR
jgi:1-phosphofructokinase family hexose kinase